MVEGTVVIGYIRVSTEEQGRSGAGLNAQEAAIREECEMEAGRYDLTVLRSNIFGRYRLRPEETFVQSDGRNR
jgi:DNA invertase Pin-like site-specific DNA recombinase